MYINIDQEHFLEVIIYYYIPEPEDVLLDSGSTIKKTSESEVMDEDIKIYFNHWQWDKLSDLEKARCKDAYRLYHDSLLKGIVLPKPDFMISNEENICDSTVKIEDMPLIDHKQENSHLDSYMLSSNICNRELKFCIGFGTLHILDNNIRKGTADRAKQTLPKNCLQIRKSLIQGEGVFAVNTIPEGIRFGPYEGLKNVPCTTGYAWKIIGGKLVNSLETEFSNWMRYVNCARNGCEQNLCAFQYKGDLYYKSIRTIDKGKELLVLYEEEFLEILSTDNNKYFKPVIEQKVENVYTCSLCCLGFSSENYLKTHMSNCPYRSHVLLRGIQCPFCNVHLTDKKYLQNHIKYCHNELTRDDDSVVSDTFNTEKTLKFSKRNHQANHKGNFKTQKNPAGVKKINNKCHFNMHLQMHNDKKQFSCEICDKKFKTKCHLKRHLIIHTGEKPFQCTICNKKFALGDILKRHSKVHTGEKPFQCMICNKKFTRNNHLKMHIKIHTGEKPFQCTVCNQKFINNNSLKLHLNIHTGEKQFQCTICNKKYTQNSHLTVHLRTHSDEKPFQCMICNKKFVRKDRIEIHLRTHTGEKPYQCTICNQRFATSKSLKLHIILHTGDKPYRCTICNKKFAQNFTLKQHLRVHTGEKEVQCMICNKEFVEKRYLKEHLRLHTGEKPFQCTICSKIFTRSCDLKRHLKIHTDEKPFQCAVCNKEFKAKRSLKTHLRLHSGE